VRFVEGDKILYKKDLVYSPHDYRYQGYIPKGKAEIVGDSLVEKPKDFAGNNFIALEDLQNMLKAILFPETVPEKARFDLKEGDYKFLYQYMSQLPRETTFPAYDTVEYYDSYSKFLMYGDKKEPLPDYIRIYNKIGMAYGYLSDNAYIVDFKVRHHRDHRRDHRARGTRHPDRAATRRCRGARACHRLRRTDPGPGRDHRSVLLG
jgi:hypothetical protein